MRFCRKLAATRLVAFSCNSVKANFDVRSMANLGDVDVEIADRVGLELAFDALAVLHVWQP
jgi:hypothetical protein